MEVSARLGRSLKPILRLISACLFAISALLVFDTGPVHAQFVPPQGPAQSASTCFASAPSSTTATACLNVNQVAGRLAATQQQLSFGAVESVLQNVRDRLQGTSARSSGRALISGYAASNLDDEPLSYASQSRHQNPLAAYNAPVASAGNSGPSWAVWGQGLADWERVHAMNSLDTNRFVTTYSGLGGVDGTWQNLFGGDALVVGLVGSWTGSHVAYDGTPTTVRLEGPGVGLYGAYVNGGFSVDATGKVDFLNLTENFAGLSPSLGSGLTNVGVANNMQYKYIWGSSFFEPTAGIQYTRTLFGGGEAALGVQDGSTLRVQGGARIGTAWNTPGANVEVTLKGLVYSNVVATGTSIATGAFGLGVIPTDRGRVRGEIDPELNLDFRNGYTAFLGGSLRFGEEIVGGSAKVGLRKQW